MRKFHAPRYTSAHTHVTREEHLKLEHLESRRLLAGTASISGSVYNDLNNNGVHEEGEAGIRNVRVYLDSNGNHRWDKGAEPSTRTSKRGEYSFEQLDAATYRVRHVVDSETTVTAPRSDWFKVTVAKGQHVTRRLFGDYTAPVPTTPSTTDDPLAGYTYYGDVDFNGSIDQSDYNLIDLGFQNHMSGWANGDVDYSGSVGATDYNVIDAAFTSQNATVLRAMQYLDGSDRSMSGMSDPSLQQVAQHYDTYGSLYAQGFLTEVTKLQAKPTAKADFKRTHDDHSLLSAKAWLSGDKDQIRSSGLQTVIDHYHQFGAEYKRAFLKLAKSY